MAQNLLEKYNSRIKVAEALYSKNNDGKQMDSQRKLILANCLKNVDSYLTDAFENSTGTQRSDLGTWKKFCINLTNVALW